MSGKIKHPIEVKEGWQFKVEIYSDYVIKKRKSREEVIQSVKNHLRFESEKKIIETAEKILTLVDKSIIILNKTKLDKFYFAYPILIDENTIKQKRVQTLAEYINALDKKGDVEKIERIIDDFVNLFVKFWENGFTETSFKFGENFGVDNDKVVLIDLFELSDKKKTVYKQLKFKPWQTSIDYKMKVIPERFLVYLNEKFEKMWTPNNIEKYWKSL